MSNILELDAILEERKKQQEEIPNVFEEDPEVTEEELDSIRKDTDDEGNMLLIKDKDETGKEVTSSLEEYTADMNEKIAKLSDDPDKAKDILRLVDNGDITADLEKVKEDTKTHMMDAFKSMAISDDLTDETINNANEKAIKAIQDHFHMDRLDSDVLAKKLKKYNARQLMQILPQEFIDLYVSKKEQATNPDMTKEKLIATIAYLVVTGPEADYLNEYIDRENRMALISKELLQCQVDFSDMLKDERYMADIIREAYKYAPKDESFWSKHIQVPNRVHNEFAQRAVMYQKYLEGYLKISDEHAGDEDAQKIIQEEIEDCNAKIEVYQSVCNLEIIPQLWKTLMDRYKSNKKMSTEFIYKEALNAIDKVKRCKQDLPFPGYDGNSKKPEIVFTSYLTAFTKMIDNYNEELEKAMKTADDTTDLRGIGKLHLNGYDDTDVHTIFAMLLLILMGRVLKKYFSNSMTKYDAIALDSYFRIFCKIGTDIYIMQDFWNYMKEDVKYALDTWYLPEKKSYVAKQSKKAKKN